MSGHEHEAARALARLDRRAFLRAVGGLAATGLLPVGCGGVPPELAPAPGRALGALSPRGYAAFQAFAARLVGPELGGAIARRELDPAGDADAWVAGRPELARVLGQGLALLEWGVWPLLPKLRPFTALDPAAQERVIGDLLRSRMDLKRDLYRGLKSLASLVVYGDPAVRARLGHPGPFDTAGIARAMNGGSVRAPAP